MIAALKDGLAKAEPTWGNLRPLFELRRQAFIQGLDIPEKGEWNHSVWRELQEQIIDFCRKVLEHDSNPGHAANLRAIISEISDDIRAEDHPLTKEKIAEIKKRLGLEDPERPQDEADWWKA